MKSLVKMDKEEIGSKPRIPASLIAHVHGTSGNAVRVAKSTKSPRAQLYKKTEERILVALDHIKKLI